MPTSETLERFIARVEANEHAEACAAFYTVDATMRENQGAPRVGRDAHVANERKVMARARSVESTCVRPVFVHGDHVVIRWIFRFTWQDGSVMRMEELACQRWDGERIAEETFFYDPAQRVSTPPAGAARRRRGPGMTSAVVDRVASCSCGQLVARTRGEPARVSVCHCLACQRRSGSVFAEQARFDRAQVTIEGRATEYRRTGDEGSSAIFAFCPVCGTTVHYRPEARDDIVVIPVGVFAEPDFPAPSVSVYNARRHAWVVMPEDMENLD